MHPVPKDLILSLRKAGLVFAIDGVVVENCNLVELSKPQRQQGKRQRKYHQIKGF